MNKFILYFLPLIFLTGCSAVGNIGILKEEPPPPARKAPQEDETQITGNVINAPVEETFNALVDALGWTKWDIAFVNEDHTNIILKEAYVYRQDGKLLRVYHWPEGQYISSSDISDYIDKVADRGINLFRDQVSFTQENMRINLTSVSEKRTQVSFEYTIRPFKLSESITSRLQSSGYIEGLILEHASKSL